MAERLIIIGTGGSAYDVLDIVERRNAASPEWEVAGFLDDAREAGSQYLGFPILGGLQDAPRFSECRFINVIGSDQSYHRRPEILERTGLARDRFATLVDPLAAVSSRAELGRGVYVACGVSVGGAAVIGDHVSLGPGCQVGHDAVFEQFAIAAPGSIISGFTRIGRSSYVGAGAIIRQRLQVGENALVGMGAVVTRDVPPGATVVGNPARPLPRWVTGSREQS